MRGLEGTRLLCYTIFETRLGWVGVAGSERGLCRLTLPQLSSKAALASLGGLVGETVRDKSLFSDIVPRLQGYFQGERMAFPDRLDIEAFSHFQRAAWEAIRLIPYGGTRSYAWVAEQIGKPRAWRAVGQALAANPLPIIVPCHRVVAAGGRIGGFRDGLELKRRLLDMEAATKSFIQCLPQISLPLQPGRSVAAEAPGSSQWSNPASSV